MEKFVIQGGVPLSGTIEPAGNKNAALPLLAACLLTEQEVVVRVKELGVNPEPDLVSKVEGLLGSGSILVEYAGRA